MCVCVCVPVVKKRAESGMEGGACALAWQNGDEETGLTLAAANVGVRCRGDGADSRVQVGVKTLGGLVFV